MTANDSRPPAVAQSSTNVDATQVSTENVAPSTKTVDHAAAPTKPKRPMKTAPPSKKIIQRSPLEPPAEIDPVPPPVEGTEPASSAPLSNS